MNSAKVNFHIFSLTCRFLLLHHFVFSQVDDEHMGQGLGGLLIDAAEDYSKRPLDATLLESFWLLCYFNLLEDSCGHTSDRGIEGYAPQIFWIMNVKLLLHRPGTSPPLQCEDPPSSQFCSILHSGT